MKNLYRNKIVIFALICAIALGGTGIGVVSDGVSDSVTVFEGQDVLGAGTSVVFTANESAVAAGKQTTYTAKLFGIIPIKNVKATIVEASDLIVGGSAFGVKLFTDGVIVTGFEDSQSDGSPYDCGVRIGDVITHVNGAAVESNDQFSRLIFASNGAALDLSIIRNGSNLSVTVTPKRYANGTYKLGIWVRDSTAGIGTVTFTDPDSGIIAGLGHGICDVDTGVLLPLYAGSLVGAKIQGIVKGQKGDPGELLGSFDENIQLAALYKNSDVGIFGKVYDKSVLSREATIPVGKQTEVKVGTAHILCDLGDGTKEYEIEIIKIMGTGQTSGKNMLISVTDKALLEKTGGIVQGMSGSPIIQDGKLIGAVTHVLVNDPTRGYGIFIENMLNAA